MRRVARQTARAQLLAEALRIHHAELRSFVRTRVAESETDDVLQAAAIRATEHIDALDDPDKIRAWLFRIVRNTITDAQRAARRRERIVTNDGNLPDIAGAVAAPACRCSVQLAQTLPAAQSTILKLVDLGDASLAEAAATLQITINNATVRLHRARNALRKRMQEHCGVVTAQQCMDCRCLRDGCCDA